ncbi:MAG: hypothetical protein ABL962_04190 [Fimbriimonadaceae bacterium]
MKTLLILALLIPGLALACINDRDTLAFEKRNVDALNRIEKETDPRKKSEAIQELVLRAIGGRFERYPARYYEMRIERLLKKGTLTAPECDDLAVAYDRLGKIDDAIRILLASKSSRTAKEEKYSFHANYGTFLVHRWIAKGHKDDDIATLKMSIAEIKKALEINPKSHFGRENVQLALEESWLPHLRSKQGVVLNKLNSQDLLVGSAGIIMMGLGYELPDMYENIALTHLRSQASESQLQNFALLRRNDLVKAGHQMIYTNSQLPGPSSVASPEAGSDKSNPRKPYEDLLADGEKVHVARLAYMESRFARGVHPDTHPDFWSEWVEPPYPVLKRIGGPYSQSPVQMIAGLVAALVAGIGLLLLRDRIRKKLAR